jgi:hypothetical protein
VTEQKKEHSTAKTLNGNIIKRVIERESLQDKREFVTPLEQLQRQKRDITEQTAKGRHPAHNNGYLTTTHDTKQMKQVDLMEQERSNNVIS